MLRTTLYGTLTHDEELNKNEKAMLYIKECAELAGLEVIEGETAFSITFMAEIMKRLRETIDSEHQWIPVSERLPEKSIEVLVTTEWDCITIGEMFSNNDWFIHEGATNASIDDIKAWMPLREPYKGENNAE